ncbi:MAG: YhbY family RNA-binding protein [Longimonas sp.]|uniref:YhbY family RNA-binding protein n=1 Tax=Longimonas sp. TaxID=2039626 RepID=UPI00334DE7CE
MSDTPSLTSKQRAFLRGASHDLDPVVRIGDSGLTPGVVAAVEEAFNTRELLKVKTLGGSPDDVRALSNDLLDRIGTGASPVHVVQIIGSIMILYRPFPEDPELELP